MRYPTFALLLLCISMAFASCESGCMVCNGEFTPERVFCEDDYQEDGRYEKEIREFEENFGTCDEQ